jgi:uncharacterized C2H2 Zn-finger protein
VTKLIDRAFCWLFGHGKRQFVRFEYPRFSPWLWTKCPRCDKKFDKQPLEHVSLRELVDNYGVHPGNIGLHWWGRRKLGTEFEFNMSVAQPEKKP